MYFRLNAVDDVYNSQVTRRTCPSGKDIWRIMVVAITQGTIKAEWI
jgi:hypothetical protein